MIFGERLRLRALEREDIPLFVRWLNDPQVTTGLMRNLPLSQIEEERWFENMLLTPAAEHPLMIEVSEGDKWVPVGDCGIHAIDWRNRSAELGILIGEKSYWNQGYGSETMRLLLKHCFDTLNLNRAYLRVFEDNPRAIRCYEKAGFVHEGRMRQSDFREGRYRDTLLMSVLRQEWRG
jgi:RimJ/RimL family protein N-acetyltransferase